MVWSVFIEVLAGCELITLWGRTTPPSLSGARDRRTPDPGRLNVCQIHLFCKLLITRSRSSLYSGRWVTLSPADRAFHCSLSLVDSRHWTDRSVVSTEWLQWLCSGMLVLTISHNKSDWVSPSHQWLVLFHLIYLISVICTFLSHHGKPLLTCKCFTPPRSWSLPHWNLLSSDMRDGGLSLYQLYLLEFLSFLLSDFPLGEFKIRTFLFPGERRERSDQRCWTPTTRGRTTRLEMIEFILINCNGENLETED